MKKVAICLSGDMRNSPECLQSLKSCVYDPFAEAGYAVDVLCHTRLDPWWKIGLSHLEHFGLTPRMLRVERNVSHIDTKDIVGPANPLERGEYPSEAKGSEEANRRPFLYQAFLQYYRSLAAVGELLERAEDQDGKEYDWVVRARPDVGYKTPLRISDLRSNTLHFPAGDWWRYKGEECRSDKFAIGPSDVMKEYFQREDYLEVWCHNRNEELHAEALMMYQVQAIEAKWAVLDDFGLVLSSYGHKYSLRPDREDC